MFNLLPIYTHFYIGSYLKCFKPISLGSTHSHLCTKVLVLWGNEVVTVKNLLSNSLVHSYQGPVSKCILEIVITFPGCHSGYSSYKILSLTYKSIYSCTGILYNVAGSLPKSTNFFTWSFGK